jgi:5-methylcytosine-specific restriction protein B
MKLKVYDATQKHDLDVAAAEIKEALAKAQQRVSPFVLAPPPRIESNDDLIGISEDVYAQINAALQSGKRHLMFYGPPGTGKTQLAVDVASQLSSEYALVTGSSDWTSQDLIGGYMPANQGRIAFLPGLLLQNFDKPFVVDELNRCDIDKVLGPLFTVLAGAPSTLPYLTDPDKADSLRYTILAEYNPNTKPHEYSPTPYWRMLATINSIDKASLYQMSYALTRRFAWILVDVPSDLPGFVVEYCSRNGLGERAAGAPVPIADVWFAINVERRIGPAPMIDLLRFCRAWKADFQFFAAPDDMDRKVYLSGLSSFVFPMLDGITSTQAERVAEAAVSALQIVSGSEAEIDLKARLAEVSI